MKIQNLVLTTVLLASAGAQASAKIDAKLADFARSNSVRPTRVVALIDLPKGREITPRRYDRARVVQYLRQRSDRAVRELSGFLAQERVLNRGVRILQAFPTSLSVLLDVSPEGLKKLAEAPTVVKIYANHDVTNDDPRTVRPARRFTDAEAPYHFETSGLNQLIKEMPHITGKDVIVGHIDTGVDGNHPALKGKVIAFYDGNQGKRTDKPVDTDRHGTHTAGTMVGGSRTENVIGVAPDAKLVSAGALGSYEQMLKGMEFMLDPDSNPATNDAPRLVSNSWNTRGAPDQELFYRAISAWEAAGILPIFSAGNSGPGAKTITPPHEHPEAYAVAATDKNLGVASFSSRGPGLFRGQETQKPDIAAPGVDVYSAVPGTGFATMSGTSMACPHVAGAATLVLQANPKLNPAQIRIVLTKSTVAVNQTGQRTTSRAWNAVFGNGHLDMAAAVKLAIQMGEGRTPPFNSGNGFGTERFFVAPQDLEIDAAMFMAPLRSIDKSWELVQQREENEGWLSLQDL